MMKIQDIRTIAKKMGIKVEKLSKAELIRSSKKQREILLATQLLDMNVIK
jgi:NACalpha-BTF3-like transcription factor